MLNPIVYTENILRDFLRYQLTAYPFSAPELYDRLRGLLNLDETRETPLKKGPYVSLSKQFTQGAAVTELVAEGVFHPHMERLAVHAHLYGHQETAVRAIVAGKTTLVSTGTGSGKTECFLYPIISHCLKLRDQEVAAGISAVLVYPMNALAEDQLERLRELLCGSGISFGMYVGKTPQQESQVSGLRLGTGSSPKTWRQAVKKLRDNGDHRAVHPPEERASREQMWQEPPRILLTNVKQLELLLTRHRDLKLFREARLDHLVFDEAHTFTGAMGAETACLIRRLRDFCRQKAEDTVCIATSATLADPEQGLEAGRHFAARFFGVKGESVVLVGEQHEQQAWLPQRQPVQPPPGAQLQMVLDAIWKLENGGGRERNTALGKLQAWFMFMVDQELEIDRWEESLYDLLSANELVYQMAKILEAGALSLNQLTQRLGERVGRAVDQEELLSWLALGAASRKEGRPLLRPVIHLFVRGIGGAVVTLPQHRAHLFLSSEDAEKEQPELFTFPILACTTCGQHYFEHHLEDFECFSTLLQGGRALGKGTVWTHCDRSQQGLRLLLLDRLIGDDENIDDIDEDQGPLLRKTCPLEVCRYCGSCQDVAGELCLSCGRKGALLTLYVARQKQEHPGKLTSCISCGSRAMGIREPARPVRAITVADVHVLAQSMILHADRKRLLVFTDNRQDAAFQAGWMQDHARRFRLRQLMYQHLLKQEASSVNDLAGALDDLLVNDTSLSNALAPEVWKRERPEVAGHRHNEERRRFLRFQVLREMTTGNKQRYGLEPWGRMSVTYMGLEPQLPFMVQWATIIGCGTEALCNGIATLLDYWRRSRCLLDRENSLYNTFWRDGDADIQHGYFPKQKGGPRAMKIRRSGIDDPKRVVQWLSDRGRTVPRHAALRWGLPEDQLTLFFQELWVLLADELQLLVPVQLYSGFKSKKVMPGCVGAHQVDADRLLLKTGIGVWRCNSCFRSFTRRSPGAVCIGHNCKGLVSEVKEDPDHYDQNMLDQTFTMVRPREHSAQIPAEDREKAERWFKGDGERVNTLVATPTLELGVDIGGLDAVLMRNIPPKSANYWQRAGRAGRRHRMAVNLAYARPASHDRAYFDEPTRMLDGRIDPPSLNLANGVMVRKHVHATVLTTLFHMTQRDTTLPSKQREELAMALEQCFPEKVKAYLYDEDDFFRREPFQPTSLKQQMQPLHEHLVAVMVEVFERSWPQAERQVVTKQRLALYVAEMGEELAGVLYRLHRRLQWAYNQKRRMRDIENTGRSLDSEQKALQFRCEQLIGRYRGDKNRRYSEGEGHDDTNTYGVLASEGFLPGYGLDTGSVVAWYQPHEKGRNRGGWEKRRSTAMALRELVPGNLIYARASRFHSRHYYLDADPAQDFNVDCGNEAINEDRTRGQQQAEAMNQQTLQAVRMCDVELPHHSHISEEEDFRYQLSVAVFGVKPTRHAGGRAFRWGELDPRWCQGLHLRLVNVGPAEQVRADKLGYPVCRICGNSRSPFASEMSLEKFRAHHRELCGKQMDNIGFYADVVADALSLVMDNRERAYSLLESLRQAAAEVLEMEIEDLQVLVIGHPSEESVTAFLYDPMQGGSGLLDQMRINWATVVEEAERITTGCISRCERSCIDCLQHFRNSWFHRHLNRHEAAKILAESGGLLVDEYGIPPVLPTTGQDETVTNQAEAKLRMLLRCAGFPDFQCQKPIDLGQPLGRTIPDFFFEDANGDYNGFCIYLDGMSRDIHGNPERHKLDRRIRDHLENLDYEVRIITAEDLEDKKVMTQHFVRLGRALVGPVFAKNLKQDTAWLDMKIEDLASAAPMCGWLELVELVDQDWQTFVKALSASGIVEPFEADMELCNEMGVTGDRALLVWNSTAGLVSLVDARTVDPANYPRCIAAKPTDLVLAIAEQLKQLLG